MNEVRVESDPIRPESQIPIENIYYLLCYAWDALDEADEVAIDPIENDNIFELLAAVLFAGTTHLLKRGLDRSYLRHDDETCTIKGKLDLGQSLKKNLLYNGRAQCLFDELSHDNLQNQILKSTLYILAGSQSLNSKLRDVAAQLYRRLHGVDQVPLTEEVFDLVHLNRNNRFYGLLLHICKLIVCNQLPSEERGKSTFRDFFRDERQMNVLFEEFLRNFYRREKPDCLVSRPQVHWQMTPATDEASKLLPKMHPDIVLDTEDRVTIMDAKYYREALGGRFDQEKLISPNLYQLFAYYENFDSGEKKKEAMLVYPTVSRTIDVRYLRGGDSLRICTINLNQPWKGIKNDLLQLVDNRV